MILHHSVIPKRLASDALAAKSALYSVSLGLDDAHERLTVAGYAWTLARFPHVLAVLGDGFLIETTLKIQGAPESVAIENGQRRAARAKAMLNAVKPNSSFVAASDLIQDPAFLAKLDQVRQVGRTDKDILAAVVRDADKYVQRLARRSRLGLPAAKAGDLARDYIIYEVAVYAHLAERGHSVEVYAGEELWVLQQFIKGQLSGFPELVNRMFVQLKPETVCV